MVTRPIKFTPKRNGEGNLSSYSVNFGSAEIWKCGFVDSDGNVLSVEKVIDEENKTITIRLQR